MRDFRLTTFLCLLFSAVSLTVVGVGQSGQSSLADPSSRQVPDPSPLLEDAASPQPALEPQEEARPESPRPRERRAWGRGTQSPRAWSEWSPPAAPSSSSAGYYNGRPVCAQSAPLEWNLVDVCAQSSGDPLGSVARGSGGELRLLGERLRRQWWIEHPESPTRGRRDGAIVSDLRREGSRSLFRLGERPSDFSRRFEGPRSRALPTLDRAGTEADVQRFSTDLSRFVISRFMRAYVADFFLDPSLTGCSLSVSDSRSAIGRQMRGDFGVNGPDTLSVINRCFSRSGSLLGPVGFNGENTENRIQSLVGAGRSRQCESRSWRPSELGCSSTEMESTGDQSFGSPHSIPEDYAEGLVQAAHQMAEIQQRIETIEEEDVRRRWVRPQAARAYLTAFVEAQRLCQTDDEEQCACRAFTEINHIPVTIQSPAQVTASIRRHFRRYDHLSSGTRVLVAIAEPIICAGRSCPQSSRRAREEPTCSQIPRRDQRALLRLRAHSAQVQLLRRAQSVLLGRFPELARNGRSESLRFIGGQVAQPETERRRMRSPPFWEQLHEQSQTCRETPLESSTVSGTSRGQSCRSRLSQSISEVLNRKRADKLGMIRQACEDPDEFGRRILVAHPEMLRLFLNQYHGASGSIAHRHLCSAQWRALLDDREDQDTEHLLMGGAALAGGVMMGLATAGIAVPALGLLAAGVEAYATGAYTLGRTADAFLDSSIDQAEHGACIAGLGDHLRSRARAEDLFVQSAIQFGLSGGALVGASAELGLLRRAASATRALAQAEIGATEVSSLRRASQILVDEDAGVVASLGARTEVMEDVLQAGRVRPNEPPLPNGLPAVSRPARGPPRPALSNRGPPSLGQRARLFLERLRGPRLEPVPHPRVSDLSRSRRMSDGRYRTFSMDEGYRGESLGSNVGSAAERRVRYFRPSELDDFEVHIDSTGRLVDSTGVPLNTVSADLGTSGEGVGIFVMDRDGRIFVSMRHQSTIEPGVIGPRIHHSSFLSGRPVSAAGEISVVDGRIVRLTRNSGHYRPTEGALAQMVDRLMEQSADLSELEFIGLAERAVTPY